DHQKKGEASFEKEMARLKRHGVPFSLVLLAIENHGGLGEADRRNVPPAVFQKLATLVRRRLRTNDSSYRHGPNQIIMLLAHCPENRAWLFSGTLLNDLRLLGDDQTETGPGGEPDFAERYEVKIGVAEAKSASELEELVHGAQSCLETLYEFRAK
ncbi:MAG: hypothetical protein AB1896_12940, partial [Thermodesulfobacteriota bacterium]